MPPRQRSLPTDFDSRLARLVAADGRQALGGMSRVGSGRGEGRGAQSVLVNVPDDDAADSSAHLLAMSVTGASIASGGDHVPFDSIVGRHGFATVVLPGEGWLHPVSGVYFLDYEHAWDTFTGGGTVRLELDGTLIPEGVIMDGADGQEGRATIAYVAEAGQVGKIHVVSGSASAQTCDAVVRVAITDPKMSDAPGAGASSGIVSLGTQDVPDEPAWTAGGASWVDDDAEWIWHTAFAGGGRPSGESAWFEGVYWASTGIDVVVEFSADNTADVWLNGVPLGPATGFTHRNAVSTTLRAGKNLIEVYARNEASGATTPAAFVLSVHRSDTGSVLFRTNDAYGWTGFTSVPSGWSH